MHARTQFEARQGCPGTPGTPGIPRGLTGEDDITASESRLPLVISLGKGIDDDEPLVVRIRKEMRIARGEK